MAGHVGRSRNHHDKRALPARHILLRDLDPETLDRVVHDSLEVSMMSPNACHLVCGSCGEAAAPGSAALRPGSSMADGLCAARRLRYR